MQRHLNEIPVFLWKGLFADLNSCGLRSRHLTKHTLKDHYYSLAISECMLFTLFLCYTLLVISQSKVCTPVCCPGFYTQCPGFCESLPKRDTTWLLDSDGACVHGCHATSNGERALGQLLSLGHCTDHRWIHTFYLSVKEAYLLALELQPEEQASVLVHD